MGLVDFSLSAVGLLLGFSLASMITVLMEWMKNGTDNNSSKDENGEGFTISIPSGPAIIEPSREKNGNHKQRLQSNYLKHLFYPLTYGNSEYPLDEIINILKIVSSLFVIVFWTLIVIYLMLIDQADAAIYIKNPIIYHIIKYSYYVLPIIGLELLLLLIFKIRMKPKALLSRASHCVVLFSMVYILLLTFIAMIS